MQSTSGNTAQHPELGDGAAAALTNRCIAGAVLTPGETVKALGAEPLTPKPLQPWARPRDAVRQLVCGATARTCLPVALVVVAGAADGVVAAKVAASCAIPFLTSSVGALLAVRQRAPADEHLGAAATRAGHPGVSPDG